MSKLKFLVFGTIVVLLSLQPEAIASSSPVSADVASPINLSFINQTERIAIIVHIQQFVLNNFDPVYAKPDSVYERVFKREHFEDLTETPIEFQNKLCQLYIQKVQGRKENDIWAYLRITYSAITTTFNDLRASISSPDDRTLEMLETIRKRKPLSFLSYYHMQSFLGEVALLLPGAIYWFFFGSAIKKFELPPDIEFTYPLFDDLGNRTAFQDETHEYDHLLYRIAYLDIATVVMEFAYLNRSHCEISNKEVEPLPLKDIPLMVKMSQYFKHMFCIEFREGVWENPILNPPQSISVEEMPSENIIEVQRRMEAFYALKRTCAATLKLYMDRTTKERNVMLDEFSNRRTLVLFSNVHEKTMIYYNDKKEFDKDELIATILSSNIHLNEEPSPFISEVQISEHILADEPGLGDEHLNFHLPKYNEICDNIIIQFNEVKKQPLSSFYATIRQRLFDLKFKTPTRFRRILHVAFEKGLERRANLEKAKREKVSAYEAVEVAIKRMFEEFYIPRIQNYPQMKVEDLEILKFWQNYDPIFFMYYMHLCVILTGQDNVEFHVHHHAFVNAVRSSLKLVNLIPKFLFHLPPLPEALVH